MTETSATPTSRLTTLDVMGIGLSIEMFQRSQVWTELEKHSTESILPSDLSAYPIDEPARELAADKRSAEALATALDSFVEHWPIPSVSVWPTFRKPNLSNATQNDEVDFITGHIEKLRKQAGMQTLQISSVGAFNSDEPEEILERIFTFFEVNPDLPALLVFTTDGDLTRKIVGDVSRKEYWEDGPRRFHSMATTAVALLLAKRERINVLRPFAGTRATAISEAGAIKPGFKPTKFLPQAWTAEQIDQFDAVQTIGELHRPIRVCYREEKIEKSSNNSSQPVRIIPPQLRQAAFKDGMDAALQTIPGGEPARVFYDTGAGNTGGNIIPLSLAAHASLPRLDLNDPEEGIDISQRIGNTGACSPFVMWALALLTSFKKKDASLAVSARQREDATITVITPSVKKQEVNQVKPASPEPLKAAAPATVRAPAPRTIALGACHSTGDECTQSGMWRCNPPDVEAGAIHYFVSGRTFPTVTVMRPLTTLQKMRGLPSSERTTATWTLVSYDIPNA